MKLCEEAVERGRAVRADFKVIAKYAVCIYNQYWAVYVCWCVGHSLECDAPPFLPGIMWLYCTGF